MAALNGKSASEEFDTLEQAHESVADVLNANEETSYKIKLWGIGPRESADNA